ncbi:AAA domain (dynein-related subfamily) [Symmachiella dynata]|uniref:AAA domain (Dynein-related subfamily) n=1 Tax=Symmachiella dynata TaxID=2527995 RepID=A0A517ZQ61_9PLAN|nr:AAA domain (dynein-related subfamily) [Symmachiella dynata]QDU44611.1 AAA domain (dynein-related subfamily) [Symmachiella dynata]|tara:strand:+ start:241 stop:1434 length:1194 start_codon:yes stop_codon:yes gene_type:complete
MAKKKTRTRRATSSATQLPKNKSTNSDHTVLRKPAEVQFADQIEALRQNDTGIAPASWILSPRAVLDYLIGGKVLSVTIDGTKTKIEITKKFFGDERIIERAIVTLASERALLLVGEPGTGKSWVSEHLAAAISGNSTLTVQGTAGTTEENIKYSWNIARVIADGPCPDNLIPSPTMVAMRQGGLLRFEEITRCVPDVQDSLVSILSDKVIVIPELPDANTMWAKPGFNVIATANTRDQGVNDLSAALKRRFNYVHIPIVADQNTEIEIVEQRTAELMQHYDVQLQIPRPIIELLATAFRELRQGKTNDGIKVKQPSTTLSTAEAIGVALDAALYAQYFGAGKVSAADVARNILGSIVKEDPADAKILKEYAMLIAKRRGKDKRWNEFHNTMSQIIP